MKTFQYILILIAGAVAAFVALRPEIDRSAQAPVEGLPWQIEVLADGHSRVFGLELPQSLLADARERFGDGMKIGIVAAQGEAGALEAYYDSVTAGIILGKMILVAQIDPHTLNGMRERSVDRTHMNDSTFRYLLAREDLSRALLAPITAITFIPAADLDVETVEKRFGPPQERLRAAEHALHFLYPDRGLHLLIDDKGKELLQYVAPRDFARLRDPLLEDAATVPVEAR